MAFLVTNCYDWVGFHIVNKLLETGYTVDGFDEKSKQDNHLSMFLGRNSSFTYVNNIDVKDYCTTIVVADKVHLHNLKSRQIIKLAHHFKDSSEVANLTKVTMPILFGEWMPMDEKGIYYKKRYISFQSNEFLTKGIHINDFTDSLIQWIRSSRLPSPIDIYSEKDKRNSKEMLESIISIRDNKPIKKQINHLIAHYKRYKNFYV